MSEIPTVEYTASEVIDRLQKLTSVHLREANRFFAKGDKQNGAKATDRAIICAAAAKLLRKASS